MRALSPSLLSLLSLLSLPSLPSLPSLIQICDFDGDGKISRQELECMLKASLVESDMALTDAQTELLLNETFAQVRYTHTLHAHTHENT